MDSLVDINYIYDSTVDKSSLDANRLLIKQKNLTPVNDTQVLVILVVKLSLMQIHSVIQAII